MQGGVLSLDVFIKLKSAGKRRPVLDDTPYTLPDTVGTLRQLIEATVRQEVEAYNNKGTDNALVPFLTQAEIEDASTVGKVGFGRLYSDKKADPDKAAEVALLGFEDGLFRVIVKESEVVELDAPLAVSEGDVITFIRLAFLAGRLW